MTSKVIYIRKKRIRRKTFCLYLFCQKMMSKSVLNDLQMVDDTDEPNLDAIGDGKELGGSVPTNKETRPKETSQTTTSTKTTGQSESVKMQRKRDT